ncbi:MAG TPA: alanine--tRNA ligase [Actinobacteria bacterium]|nr:alanine--tRNA ligase [Actinomycetota bacterium]
MRSSEIRKKFLSFFEKKGHVVLPSSSLAPDDPTLLLTTAGMVQFKPIFQGEIKPTYTRAATVQKCVRTTDIENVGHTARHLTFFEMLGNFSFGDYYKKEIIPWSWEFLTKDLGFDKSKLWITVYKEDDEAFDIWHKDVGIPKERIVIMGEEDNFWSAGPTGPCGPCSEILYDFGEEEGCGKPNCSVGCDCDRFLEVWNLVFMQFNRDDNGILHPLPKKNVDTGLGLERAASILQKVPTNFETDLIKPIIDKIAEIGKINYGDDKIIDTSLKIIADHARAMTLLVGDGILPSNEGRGYVLRRLIRRAVRHGRLIGIEKRFLTDISAIVISIMKDTYVDLKDNDEYIYRILENEEERFSATLKQGLNILDAVIEREKGKGSSCVDGNSVFQLYDTYGFPLELTREIAEENGLEINQESFDELMRKQRKKARSARGEARFEIAAEVYTEVFDQFGKTKFIGYSKNTEEANIQSIIRGNVAVPRAQKGDEIEIILDQTPFYAERGGQVGDEGLIETSTGKVKVNKVFMLIPEMFIHKGVVEEGVVEASQKSKATVDAKRRKDISRNHTATHILHWALRKTLGNHVKQAGSYVGSDRLRFDFTHFESITSDSLQRIERLVNEKIMENESVKTYVTSFDFAREQGATALFGEKYGKFVRVLEVGDFSKELCGGTHVGRTGEMGLFKIVSEGSVAANTRRIEALTSYEALNYVAKEEEQLKKLVDLLKVKSSEVVKKVKNLMSTLKKNEKTIENLQSKIAKIKVKDLISSAHQIGDLKMITGEVDAEDMIVLRSFIDMLREGIGEGIIVLGASSEGKALLISAVSAGLVKSGFSAGAILKKIAPIVSGGGGGKPEMAQAGGKNPDKLKEALMEAVKYVQKEYDMLKNNK